MPNSTSRRTAAICLVTTLGLGAYTPTLATPLTFAFDWPADLKAHASFTAKRTQTSPGATRERKIEGSFDMTTSRVDDGLRVAFTNFKARAPATGDEMQNKIQGFMLNVGAKLPNFVVASSGELVRLEGVTALRRNAVAALEELVEGVPGNLKAQLETALQQLTSEARLKRSVQRYWQRDVAAWIGHTVAPGDANTRQRQQVIPMLGGPAPSTMTISFVELRPCYDGATKQCAMLEVRDVVTVTDLDEHAAERLKAAMPNVTKDLRFSAFSMESTVTILTEPSTLLPHETTLERAVRVGFTVDGKETETGQVEFRKTTYDYR